MADADRPVRAQRARCARRLARSRGSAGVVTVLCLLAVGLVVSLLVTTAQATIGAARAQAAADAAALGALHGGEAEAHELARRNGAQLIGMARRGSCVEVLVRVGRSQARARAAPADGQGGYPCDEEASRRLDDHAHR
jgi:hypothetical protein